MEILCAKLRINVLNEVAIPMCSSDTTLCEIIVEPVTVIPKPVPKNTPISKNITNGVLVGKNAKTVPLTTKSPILIIKIFCGLNRDNILPAINEPTIQKIELGVVAKPAKVAGNPKIPCVHDGT